MARAINPAQRRQVLSVLEETARSVQHLDAPVLRKMIPILRHAHAELEEQLRRWLAREDGAATFSAQRYRNAITAVRHAQATARRLAPGIEDALWEGADTAGKLSTSNILRELERFGHIFEGTIQPVSIDAAAVIAAGDKVLWKQFESSARTYVGSIGENVIQELAISRVKAETIFETTNRLQRNMPHLFASDRWGAERLARTETLNAYNEYHLQGIKEIAEEDPEILARWDVSFDWRRCPMCASLDGQVRDVANGEKFVADWFTKRKKGALHHRRAMENAPAHPCCRCCVTPWRQSWAMVARARATPAAPAAAMPTRIAARPRA
jgi:hypothetical protein